MSRSAVLHPTGCEMTSTFTEVSDKHSVANSVYRKHYVTLCSFELGIIDNEGSADMSRLDLTNLAIAAAQNIQTADKVSRDPAVVKAARQFAEDGTRAVRSGGALIRETRSSWDRNSR